MLVCLRPFELEQHLARKEGEKTKEGHLIIREGSSEFFSEETLEEKFTRILSRFENKEIQFVFKHLDVSVNELLCVTLRSSSLSQLLESIDGRLEITASEFGELKLNEKFRGSWAIGHSRMDVLDDCVVATDEAGAKALDLALGKLRAQLLKD